MRFQTTEIQNSFFFAQTRQLRVSWALSTRVWGGSLENSSKHKGQFLEYKTSLLSVATRVEEFSNGNTKLERFLPKNQHTQRKSMKFEFWINVELSKIANIWLSKSIFYVKNHRSLSDFFFHWRISIKEHICCYWHFLIKSIFKAVYY